MNFKKFIACGCILHGLNLDQHQLAVQNTTNCFTQRMEERSKTRQSD